MADYRLVSLDLDLDWSVVLQRAVDSELLVEILVAAVQALVGLAPVIFDVAVHRVVFGHERIELVLRGENRGEVTTPRDGLHRGCLVVDPKPFWVVVVDTDTEFWIFSGGLLPVQQVVSGCVQTVEELKVAHRGSRLSEAVCVVRGVASAVNWVQEIPSPWTD